MSKRYLSGFDIVCDQATFNEKRIKEFRMKRNILQSFIYMAKEGKNECEMKVKMSVK